MLPGSRLLPLFPALIGKQFFAFPQKVKFIDIGTPTSYKEAETFFMKNGRERLAQTVEEARAEYASGEVGRGTVDDLMLEITQEEQIIKREGTMQMNMIISDPTIMMGKPVIAGSRITVELILEKLAAGESIEQILESHPRLTREGIQAALAYPIRELGYDKTFCNYLVNKTILEVRRPTMEIQFITDAQGKKTAAIVPFDEWERTETAKEILEHVYLDGIIKERRDSKPTVSLDDLLTGEGLTRADLES